MGPSLGLACPPPPLPHPISQSHGVDGTILGILKRPTLRYTEYWVDPPIPGVLSYHTVHGVRVQDLPRDSHMSKPQVDSPVHGILSHPTVPWGGQDHLRDHMSHPQVDFGILSCPTVPWSGWECPRDFHIFSSHSPVRWMNTQ